ncbi:MULTISPECIES: STM4012 family radical SAM protein [unclassified Parabacteroides]|uniref:STM4012 family radical SAM protein n=1 Tax=unclassified Parabacteroides TaxID=2649774 RepID=UPI002473A14B|nr:MULTISPECIES: STM4012 family radical SAM protein [unclassified Parabacteroides]
MNSRPPQYLQYLYSYPHKTAYQTFTSPVAIANYLEQLTDKKASLYFHIPFCRYKCGFCNLFSLQGCNNSRIEAYLETMKRQAGQLSTFTKDLSFTSFAIGGGTPLVLNESQLETVFDIASLLGVDTSKTFTSIETSPDFTNKQVLGLLKERGVERISIGIQSFRQEELQKIRRSVSIETCASALETIQQATFPQFNIDLIYGIEGQTVESFLTSIQIALSYQPTELFMYPLYARQELQDSSRAKDEILYIMYKAGRDALIEQSFTQTSMRRFVKKASPDLEYSCGDETMISCGCGGRSYIGKLHYATPYATKQTEIRTIIDQYIKTTDFTLATNGLILSREEQRKRYIIKNLLYYKGIDKADYEQRFGEAFHFPFELLIDENLVEDKEGFIRLTREGLAYSDEIGLLFV